MKDISLMTMKEKEEAEFLSIYPGATKEMIEKAKEESLQGMT